MTARASEMQDLEAFSPAVGGNALARWAFRLAGALLVGLGVLGIFLPLLPTTIFLLGAAACFGRSSPGAYRWLTTNRLFGRYLREYREEKGATASAKLFSIATLWLGIGATTYVFRSTGWLDILLVAVAMAVTFHLLSLRTLSRGR